MNELVSCGAFPEDDSTHRKGDSELAASVAGDDPSTRSCDTAARCRILSISAQYFGQLISV